MNLSTGSITSKDLHRLPEGGNVELPSFNRLYDGLRENCFTYLVEFFGKQDLSPSYGFDLIKYDSCREEVSARWSTPYYLPNEPYFIADPNGVSEDDGMIMVVSYDFNKDVSVLVAIDPKEMKTVQEYEMPFRVPWTLHSGFWGENEMK